MLGLSSIDLLNDQTTSSAVTGSPSAHLARGFIRKVTDE